MATEMGTQCGVLRGYAYRAGVGMAFSHEQTTQHNELRRSESELTGTEQRHGDDVTRSFQLPVNLNLYLTPQAVTDERLLSF